MDKVALDYFGKKITYGLLFDEIIKVANGLVEWGVVRGEVIPTYSLNFPEFIAVFYALNILGAIPDLKYMNLSKDDMCRDLVQQSPKHIITVSTFLPRVLEACGNVIEADKILVLPLERSLPFTMKLAYSVKQSKIKRYSEKFYKYETLLRRNSDLEVYDMPDATAMIVHTGGTTGRPKSVKLSNENANAVAFQYKHSLLKLHQGDTILNIAPPFIAFGICLAIHTPLCLGLCVQLSPNPDPETTAKVYGKYKPQHFLGGPAHIKNIVDSLRIKDLSFAATVGYGGESIGEAEEEKYVRFFVKKGSTISHLTPGYGMTEFGGTVVVCGKHVFKKGSVGIPFCLSNIKIVDTVTRLEMHYGEIGEILLNSPSMMQGYIDSQENIFVSDENGNKWIKTGDLGAVDEDGFVFLHGRLKRMYLIKGQDGTVVKLYPDYIEEKLLAMPEIKDCAVIAIEQNKAHWEPIAYIVLDNDSIVSEKEIMNRLNKNLPEYECVHKVIIVDKIPKTNSGKKNYAQIEKEYKEFKLVEHK